MSAEMEARHKKELKWLEQEKRVAIKKIKGTAGKGKKKAKEQLAAAEAEYDAKIKALKERHAAELSAASGGGGGGGEDTVGVEHAAETTGATADNQNEQISAEEEERQHKQEKARRKREKAREKERERERQIAEETANAGPPPRQVENEMILQHLEPLNLTIREVAADGHCMYRAVALQCSRDSEDYPEMRRLCAETLAAHEDDFAPFCEYSDTIPDYSTYIERVRSSNDWGGHLELRVLSMALKRPVWIYDAIGIKQPMVIDSEGGHDSEPLRLSYHRQYYALGEHYNEVVPKDEAEA